MKNTEIKTRTAMTDDERGDGRQRRYKTRGLGAELLVDLQSQIALILEEAGIQQTLIDEIRVKVVEQMSFHWGGQIIYFPMGSDFKSFRRDWAIYNEFTGRNHAELAHKYGVSRQTIYKAISRVRTYGKTDAEESDE